MIGIPITGGFFAKFYVFSAALQANLVGLVIIGVLNSAVGAYYYLRIIVMMYMREPREDVPVTPVPVALGVALAVSVAGHDLSWGPAGTGARIRLPLRRHPAEINFGSCEPLCNLRVKDLDNYWHKASPEGFHEGDSYSTATATSTREKIQAPRIQKMTISPTANITGNQSRPPGCL